MELTIIALVLFCLFFITGIEILKNEATHQNVLVAIEMVYLLCCELSDRGVYNSHTDYYGLYIKSHDEIFFSFHWPTVARCFYDGLGKELEPYYDLAIQLVGSPTKYVRKGSF